MVYKVRIFGKANLNFFQRIAGGKVEIRNFKEKPSVVEFVRKSLDKNPAKIIVEVK